MTSKISDEMIVHKTDRVKIKGIKENLPDEQRLDQLSQFFKLLSDPTRLKIVLALKLSELCVHEIAETVGISISAISHQLRLLKSSRVVKGKRSGKHIYYSLDDFHVEQLISVADEHLRESY